MSQSHTPVSKSQKNRHLVLDDRLIDETIAAKLTLGEITKHPQNPLFGEDKPWEPRFDNVYANVIYDVEDKLYKCWYNPFIIDERVTHTPPEKRHPDCCNYMDVKPNTREMGLCYAYSMDGIHWEKPDLGLVALDGNKQNNILMRCVNGAGVFKDERETDPAKRYKMFFCGEPQMTVAFSADGLHWSEALPIPQIEAHGTHPNAFWAETLGKYVGWGTIFPSAPIFFHDEIWIYYGAGDGYFFNWRNGYLALATLRSDGWAGYEPIATDMPAVITTQPLTFDGTSVGITADVSDDGSVRVAILDKAGNQLVRSQLVRSTVTDCSVQWEPSQGLADLRGKEIRLRFQLHNAKLYAFQIEAENG